MKKAISMIIALVLVVLITIVAASAAYYWLVEVQSEMQAGTSRYQTELTEQVTSRLHIIDFQYNINNNNAKITIENSGSRKLEDIGSSEDSLIITTKTSSCNVPFNSSNCGGCPFDLEVNEVKEINIDFANTDCSNIEEGTEYIAYFALKGSQAQSSFIPTLIYDVWVQKFPSDKPSARWEPAMATIDGTDRVVLFGGRAAGNCDGSGSVYCNGTWIYDYSDNNWNRRDAGSASSGPEARIYPSLATIFNEDKVVLFGGTSAANCDNSGSVYCNGTWIYDYSDDNWTQMSPASKPSARYWHATAALDNEDTIILFGGWAAGNCDGSGSVYCNGTWMYNYSADSWNRRTAGSPTASPSARYAHAITTIYGTDKVLLFGGFNGSTRYDETWVYDYSDDAWTQMSPASKPNARYVHAMAAIDGTDKVLLFGGWTSGHNDETWVYDYSDDAWTQMSPASKPSHRYEHEMAAIDGTEKIILFGGLNVSLTFKDDTWEYI